VNARYENAVLPFVTRSRARRAEKENAAETTAMVADGRCSCGCGLPAAAGGRSPTCASAHKAAVKNAFAGLGL
jgi:hypothetical protein